MNSFGKMAHRNIWTGRLRSRMKRRKLGQSLVYHSQWTSKLVSFFVVLLVEPTQIFFLLPRKLFTESVLAPVFL